jgi:hypothetical protein
MGFKETKFKTIKLTEGDALFIHYVLKQYVYETHTLKREDIEEIKQLATKFK